MYSSSSSSSYTLEITIRSAESLTMGRKNPVRKNLFVTISLEDGRNYHVEKQRRTKVYQEDESYHPAWDEKFTMDVPIQVKFVVLEVHSLTWSGDKTVGVAKVPVSDFVGNSNTPLDYLHFLSYRLRDSNEDPNGIINFSVKILKGLDFGYSCGARNNYYNNGANDIHSFGYGNKENCVPKHGQQPWQATPSVGYPRNSSAAVVGVPAAWYST